MSDAASKPSASRAKPHDGLALEAPRRVPVRPTLALMLICATAAVIAVCALGIASLAEAMRLNTLARYGTNLPAQVTALYYGDTPSTLFDPDRAQEIHSFEYRFTTPQGEAIVARAPVEITRPMLNQGPLIEPRIPTDTAHGATVPPRNPEPPELRYVPGHWLNVRYAVILGRAYYRPWDKPPKAHTAYLAVSGITLISVALVIGLAVLRRIGSGYLLVRDGILSEGVIVSKEVKVEETVRYYVTFAPAKHGGGANEWTRRCSPQQYLGLKEGDTVTLIAPPDRRDQTTLYRLLPFGPP